MEMLDDLDEAWDRAAQDDDVRVIVLRANGKHFSAGHDLKAGSKDAMQSAFDIHQAGHGHAISEAGFPVLLRLEGMKREVARNDAGG